MKTILIAVVLMMGWACEKPEYESVGNPKKVRLVVNAKKAFDVIIYVAQPYPDQAINSILKTNPNRSDKIDITIDTTMYLKRNSLISVVYKVVDRPEYKIESEIIIYENDTIVREFVGKPINNLGHTIK